MKIASLIATAALTALGQDGVIQNVKHGAKKAGVAMITHSLGSGFIAQAYDAR